MNQQDKGISKNYGLQKVYENMNQNNELTELMFGIDLTNFGLDLNDHTKKLHENFGFPFSDQPTRKTDPMNFKLPDCYLKPTAQLSQQFIKKFSDETLFYIFYNMTDEKHREKYQQWAVEELYERKWQYNSLLKTFFADLKDLGNGNYQCKYFNVKKWKYTELQSIELDLEKDFLSIEQFISDNN